MKKTCVIIGMLASLLTFGIATGYAASPKNCTPSSTTTCCTISGNIDGAWQSFTMNLIARYSDDESYYLENGSAGVSGSKTYSVPCPKDANTKVYLFVDYSTPQGAQKGGKQPPPFACSKASAFNNKSYTFDLGPYHFNSNSSAPSKCGF